MKTIHKLSAIILTLIAVLVLVASALAATGDTTRLSVSSSGTQGSGDSIQPAISLDGRYVAFASGAGSLVGNDYNLAMDILVRDLNAGTTTLVSVTPSGVAGNNDSFAPSLSMDGRYIAFQSYANNLVVGDTNNMPDIFVRNLFSGTTTRVSVNSMGEQALIMGSIFPSDGSWEPSISANGRYVAFRSNADNLVTGDTNDRYDIFVHDLQTGTTTRVSVDSNGTEVYGESFTPSISSDGRYVAFFSGAGYLVSGDTNLKNDIFVHDNLTGTTTRVSVNSNGEEGNNHADEHGLDISADGRYVTFSSYASNLVAGDINNKRDVFVRDLMTGTTTRVSVDSNGNQANDDSYIPSISADGRYVAFESFADNLVNNDTNGHNVQDVFMHDRITGVTTRVSVATDGSESNGVSFIRQNSLSADGRFIVFASSALNLVSPDTNNTLWDIFLHETNAPSWQTFADVPISYWSWDYIERLYDAGITGGCTTSPLNYCPENEVTRAQMAIFLEKGVHFPVSFTAPDVAPTFGDTIGHWAEDWIEALKNDGVTSGCATGLYCPENPVTRAQMAVFLLKAKHGVAYTPPAATGVFTDVPVGYWADKWIEQLAAEGITGGCATGLYCPDAPVTRAQMAVFLVKTFTLP